MSNKDTLRLQGSWQLITAGFAAIFILLGLALWTSLATVKKTNDSLVSLVENTERKTNAAHQMREHVRIRNYELESIRHQAGPEDLERVFDAIAAQTARYNQTGLELNKLIVNDREHEITAKIRAADERVLNAYAKAGDAFYSMLESDELTSSTVGAAKLQETVLLKLLNDLVELQQELATESLDNNHQRYSTTQKTLTVLSLLALCLGVVIATVVVTRVSRANRRIVHLANHDDLTGLNNRRAFEEKLGRSIRKARGSQQVHALMYLDLDRFKVVNDTCGHHAGDELLKQLTAIFTSEVGKKDTVARLGGDEFAIICSASTFDDIIDMADRLRKRIDSFIFDYEKRQFSVSMSVGVIRVHGDETDIEILMNNVDSACYVAKQSGRNRVHVASTDDAEILRYRASLENVQRIRNALNDEQFELFYQPVFDISGETLKVEHCEILLRIKDEDGTFFSPEEFIPLAEQYNLMSGIDRWVVKNAIAWIESHQSIAKVPRLLVNLSALSYTDELFLKFLIKTLEEADIDYTHLAFEITETAAVGNTEKASEFINRIKQFGCRFALDDFGTGFSTFAYLKQLPIDYLKIDGTLVRNMCNDTIDHEMVRAINQIGHIVGAQTIAEFVENDDIKQSLKDIGVDYGQGFGLRRPAPLEQMIERESLPPADESTNGRSKPRAA